MCKHFGSRSLGGLGSGLIVCDEFINVADTRAVDSRPLDDEYSFVVVKRRYRWRNHSFSTRRYKHDLLLFVILWSG